MRNIWGFYISCRWRIVVGMAFQRIYVDPYRTQYRMSLIIGCFAFVVTLLRIDKDVSDRFYESERS